MPYEIINRKTDDNVAGIKMGNKTGTFVNNIMRTNDPVIARDIRQRFGQDRRDGRDADVLVAEVPDRTTGKTFAMGIEFDENGKRI